MMMGSLQSLGRLSAVALAGLFLTSATRAELAVKNVTATPRSPWNGSVEVSYEVTGSLGEGREPHFSLLAIDRETMTTNRAEFAALTGDAGTVAGRHSVVWDMMGQGLDLQSTNVVFSVGYEENPLYMVLDLSGGASVNSYPMTFLGAVPGGTWDDSYKTNHLVLRRIDPGTFGMGASHVSVTLTKQFYIGVFEVTQKQYELTMGEKPSVYKKGDMRPVEKVSWTSVRGSGNWPLERAVGSASFMGKMRERVEGMPFDLPTQAQWEYACRAGTTSLYNDGTDDDVTAMGRLGRCSTNQGDGKGEYPQCHTTVGSYLPNSWGLYDMHGNVAEMCLDWYTGTLAANVEDPEGPINGTARVVCGGSWADRADSGKCSSPASTEVQPRMEMRYGFRLCCTLPDANTFLVSCSGESDPVAIGEPVVRTYVVRYAVGGDGVDGVMAEQALTNGMAATLNTNCFTRAGYEFAGWSRSLSGTVEFADGAEVLDLASGGEVTLYAVWTPLQVAAPTIFPPDGSTFTGDTCVVSMSCATEEADIYYTTNGRTPRINEACRYKGPFTITDTTTVLSFAVKGEIESTLVEVTITKTEPDPLTLKEVLDETKLDSVTTGGDADWTPVEDAGAKIGGSSARSGAVGMEQASWMETTVNGAGTLTFWWKTSCEADPRGRYTYDHAEFSVDGEIRERLDGESDWRQCEVSLDAPGVHVLRWTYVTDDWEEPGFQDCAWVDAVEWTPAGGEATETQTTEVPVPHVWLDRYFPGTTDYERTAKAPAANSAYSVMECYVAGLDPTDATATFSTVIEMRDCAPVISWSPNLNTNGVIRTYRILGRERLDDGNEWSYPTNSSHRFFKVSVGLPEP